MTDPGEFRVNNVPPPPRPPCDHCRDWGATLPEDEYAIPCPACGRRTYPNLGVNCPAGSAVAVASAQAMFYQRRPEGPGRRTSEAIEAWGPPPELLSPRGDNHHPSA